MTTGGFSFGNPLPPATTTGAGSGGGGFSFGRSAAANNSTFGSSIGGTFTTAANSNVNRGPSSSSSLPPKTSVRALAWDPTGTASLSLCPLPSSSKDSNNSVDDRLDVFLSHDGTGCPMEETACLLRCLDAREEWMTITQQQQHQQQSKGAAVTKLSMDYRAAMCECLMMLQKKTQDNADSQMMTNDSNDEESSNNLELLNLTYAISHLAEIFLLPSLALDASASASNNNFGGGFHDDALASSRLDGPAGSLTSDTVRYLRLHHSKMGGSDMLDLPQVVSMLESDQPEYYQFPPSSSNDNIGIPTGPYDHPFWNLLLQFVIQGELSNAWTLLSHHSACRFAEEEAMTGEHELSPEGQGFAALRAILLSAPIPGGRGDGYCDDAGLDDYLEEELLEQQEEEESGRQHQQQFDENNAEEDPGDINELLIDGVPPNAYLLWEALPRHADTLRTLRYRRDLRLCGQTDHIEGTDLESPTVPEVYQPRVALNAFQNWQETIRVTAFPAGVSGSIGGGGQQGGGVLSALFKRFPPLPQILSILLGVVPPAIATNASLAWSEGLLMELLYARPDIMPEDIATRAQVAMSKEGGGGGGSLQDIILSIMNGSAGQVVQTMFSLCGGSSGAALPATMTSLLCNLLVDAGCISPQNDSSTKLNIQTELLLLAAESILSSFSVQEQSDVGVRTTVRFLLPHAPPKRAPRTAANTDSITEVDIIYEPRIAAMIAEALSHRLPTTDAEARDLLQLCEGPIQLGSVIIADACESLAFSRASHYSSNGNLTHEAHWLLRGMEVQSCWLPSDRQRTLGFASRRHFDSLCERSAHGLISMLSIAAVTNFSKNGMTEKQEKDISTVLRAAEDVLEGVLQDDVMATTLKGHVEANLLKYAVDIALSDAQGDTVQVATDIVHCLEERCSSEDSGGVVSTLADPKVYTDLLDIAFAILVKEDETWKGGPMEFATCAFTIHGMHILMARLTQLLSWEGVICSSHVSSPSPVSKRLSAAREEYFNAMRVAFCKGLMHAFVSNKQPTATKASKKKESIEVSLEEEMELMLSPCI